jgi:hypothetical protein
LLKGLLGYGEKQQLKNTLNLVGSQGENRPPQDAPIFRPKLTIST